MAENLKETVKGVVTETQEPVTPPAETKKDSSTEGAETKSGETVEPIYVRGINVSDIPEADRAKFTEKLEEKLALVDKGNQEIREGLSKEKEGLQELIQTRDYLQSRGVSPDDVNRAIDNLVHQKTNPSKKEAVRTLDKLIEQAPPDQRANLEQFRTIVKEETNVDALKKEVEALKGNIQVLSQGSVANESIRLTKELSQLSTDYGEEFITKHKKKVMAYATNPQARGVSAENLLFMSVPPSEIKSVLAKSPQKVVTEKKQAVSSIPSGVNAKETIDVKTTSLKDVIRKVIRK